MKRLWKRRKNNSKKKYLITFHYVHLIEYSLFLRTVNMIHMHVETSDTKGILKFPILKKGQRKKNLKHENKPTSQTNKLSSFKFILF